MGALSTLLATEATTCPLLHHIRPRCLIPVATAKPARGVAASILDPTLRFNGKLRIMSITFTHGIDIPQPPAKVFALLDDVSQTPKWLSRCIGVEVLTPGPMTVGTRLRYEYREGSRTGKLEGEIAERTEDEKLLYHYEDSMMRVAVQFTMTADGAGTRLTHTIDITPKTFMAKMLTPLIRGGLPKQTIDAMESLRRLLG